MRPSRAFLFNLIPFIQRHTNVEFQRPEWPGRGRQRWRQRPGVIDCRPVQVDVLRRAARYPLEKALIQRKLISPAESLKVWQ